jgi:energy-converting hydrogenase Eha subunit C
LFFTGAVKVEDLVATDRLIAAIAAALFAEVSDVILLIGAGFCVEV